MTDLHHFLYPRSRYRGSVKPENLVFNANLQEFSQRVSYISGLQTNASSTLTKHCNKFDHYGSNFKKVINN